MNTYFFVAGALLGIMGLNHNTLGTRFVVDPILKMPNIPPLLGSVDAMRRVVLFSWYLTGVGLWGYAYLLVHLGRSQMDATGIVISWMTIVINAISAVIVLVISRGKHFSWPIFAAVSVLTWLGLGA